MRITLPMAIENAYHEAVVQEMYFDSERVPTWSVGMTDATGHRVLRYKRNPAPMQKCIDVYVWALNRYAQQVIEAFAPHVLTEEQFAAALSFHWNTGGIKRAHWVEQWKRGNIQNARVTFMNWSKPTSIIERRERERDLFFDGVWSNNGTILHIREVTKNLTPRWSSAVRLDITEYLEEAFYKMELEERKGKLEGPEDELLPDFVELDQDPKPDQHPGITLSPEGMELEDRNTVTVATTVIVALISSVGSFILGIAVAALALIP